MGDVTDLGAIRTALEAGEFFLLYQPIVSLADRHCVGAEALIRWRRGSNLVVDAGEFIPHTDGTTLSGPITYWVMDSIALELGEWLRERPGASISINVPPEILGRGGIGYAATKSGLKSIASQLILEITERGIPDQIGLDALNELPQHGPRIALDDTTLSGANLALLTRCHFDYVKIAHALVHELDSGPPHPTWFGGLAALIERTSLQVIAEGVENERQLEVLTNAGVQLAQGNWLAPPLPAEAFKRYYATSRAAK